MRRLVLLICLTAVAARGQGGDVHGKKLIEFGWDEPGTAFLRAHISQMQRTPFDGCVFHVDAAKGSFTWEDWGSNAFSETDLQAAFADARAVRSHLGKFKCNFLRFNTTPGNLDWFDDFSAVTANARLAARLAKTAHGPGILFDIEQYQSPLFNYRKQRDVKTKSWELYAAQARRRGREVMTAFEEGCPGLTVFLTFGYSLPWAESDKGRKSLADCSYGLLAPFLDGMVEAARRRDQIIDGFELSYGYKTAAQFAAGRKNRLEDVLPIVRDEDKYKRVFSGSFGLWLDFDWRTKGWNAENPATNYFTPASFQTSVHEALQQADKYVWIYSETPRWWSGAGASVKLPDSYAAALRAAQEK